MEEEAVRWSIKVSRDTDLILRTFLGSQRMKKGDLSKFIEEAVRRRVLQCTIQDIRPRNADSDPMKSSASSNKRQRTSGRTPHQTEDRPSLMRVVLDTNIIVPALVVPTGKPAAIVDAWLDGESTLISFKRLAETRTGRMRSASKPTGT